jgi:signal transduction histidine kinase
MNEQVTFTVPTFLAGGGRMGAMMRSHDWSGSPLGNPDTWPPCLRSTVSLLLGSRFPMFVAFGPELGFLYNDAYAEILGDKHPAALGHRFRDIWAEIWSDIFPLIERALAGEPTWSEDMPLTMNRRGHDELTWFTFSYSPVRDEEGRVAGMFCACTETTARVQAETALRADEARLAFLDRLGKATTMSTEADEILATTTRMVAEHLGLSNCAYADMDPDEDGFTIRGDWAAEGSPSIVGHYSLADFGRRAVEYLGAGRPLIINDNLAELPPEEAATFQAIGIGATICMPLVKDGRLTALMAIHDRVPHAWSGYELALITEVTERSWAHIERVRAVAALREAVDKLEALNATLEERVEERTSKLVETEAVLRQSQKLEAVGQLTGGVAHDFNNLLTIIRSSVDFLRRPDLPDERRTRYLNAVSETVDRASKLTSQLLAFARRQTLKPETLDVGARLRLVGDLLDTVTGARIEVVTEVPEHPCFVRVDTSQFETALVNMAVNARDAMDGAGTLTLTLRCGQPLPSIKGPCERPGAIRGGFPRRHGVRHPARPADPRLRAVLHDEGGRQGHRLRPVPGLRFRQAIGRRRGSGERAGPGHDLHALPSRGRGRVHPARGAGRRGAGRARWRGPARAGGGGQRRGRALRHADPGGPRLRDDLGDQRRGRAGAARSRRGGLRRGVLGRGHAGDGRDRARPSLEAAAAGSAGGTGLGL